MNRSFTNKWRRLAGWLLPLFAGLSLGGCQVAHMALPPDMQSDASELTVDGRALSIFSKSFQFGPYQVTDIHRGWTKGRGWSVSSGATEFSSSKAKQKYEFSLSESDRAAWQAHCATVADWSDLETNGFLGGRFGIEFTSNQRLVCTLNQDGGAKPLRLIMARSANAGDTALKGVVMDGATQIEVSGTHKLDATPIQVSTPTGYIFRAGGRPVGAVEVINKGTVWLDNAVTPETRSALAATAAVLLLYQDIEKSAEAIKRM